jgi:2-succinyl-6-hydroxy-2,4-cyclohexadiene-1-carboxylate synthase
MSREGKSPPAPVVFLHGFTGDSASSHALQGELAERSPDRGFRAYTLTGHEAEDEARPDVATFEEEVERIASQVRRDGLEGACLCGYSMGGRVALALIVRHPALFTSAVLIGASPGLAGVDERMERRDADARWLAILEQKGTVPFVEAWQDQPMFESQRRLPRAVQDAERARKYRHSADRLALAMRVLGLAAMPNLWPALASITIPVHLVVGELDLKFRALGQRMLAILPRGHLHVIERAGHNVVLERPEVLARRLEEAAGDR